MWQWHLYLTAHAHNQCLERGAIFGTILDSVEQIWHISLAFFFWALGMIFLHSEQCALQSLQILVLFSVVLSACLCTVGCISALSSGKISFSPNQSPQIEQSCSTGRVPSASLRHIPSHSSGFRRHILPDGTGNGSTFPMVSRGIIILGCGTFLVASFSTFDSVAVAPLIGVCMPIFSHCRVI
jgi:hypothetical protein